MDKNTAERKTISKRTFDILVRAIMTIIGREPVSKLMANVLQFMCNISFIGVTSIFVNQFCNWRFSTAFGPVYYCADQFLCRFKIFPVQSKLFLKSPVLELKSLMKIVFPSQVVLRTGKINSLIFLQIGKINFHLYIKLPRTIN